jgi:hypothetical protein
MLRRLDGWPGLLESFIHSRRYAPFQWGKNDCVLFSCDAALVMTGEDLARGFRDTYDTARGAVKTMHLLGASSVGELADIFAARLGLRVLPATFAQRGDVVLLNRELGESLGIVALSGIDVWAPAEEGLAEIPIREGLRAWRI